MSKRSADSELRREIASRLKDAIRDNHLTRKKAADALGVKRQTLWLYLKERATPGGDVLRRAFELWGITLRLQGCVITKESLGPEPAPREKLPEQLSLIDLLDGLEDRQLEATVIGRREDYFELKVRIKARASASK
jgi:transcriptional regulator with XRE-family HTH domain